MNNAAQLSDVIICPTCSSEIPLTDAVEARLRNRLDAEIAVERKRVAEQLRKLSARENSIKEIEAQFAQRVETAIAAERTKLAEAAIEKAREELGIELNDKSSELTELRGQLKKSQATELVLRKSERQLKERAESLDLEVARRMDEERGNVRKKALADATEEYSLKQAEKDLKIEGLLKKINELKQKAEQGSMQVQGEVLELDLEGMLRQTFATDNFSEVAKGTNGADVSQDVVSPSGQTCGSILWETKRTKNWNSGWLPKLRDDQRAAKASVAVIVSEALPPDVRNIACIEGVWVCSRSCATGLASALRAGIIEVAKTRQAAEGRNEKVELVYSYLSGPEFQARVTGIVEAFVALQDGLAKERQAMHRIWSKREKQLERAVVNATGLYGDLEGIIGASMPQIEELQLVSIEDQSSAA